MNAVAVFALLSVIILYVFDTAQAVLPFLQFSGNGYIVAVATPFGIGNRHAFHAVNFELHFNLADNATFSPTALKTRWEGRRKRSIEHDDQTDRIRQQELRAEPESKKQNVANMLNRKSVYRVIESNMFRYGINGTACLLKTICSTAEHQLYENNGVVGNVFHIIFTPSSSEDENLPQFFYDAEEMGKWGKCDEFDNDCPMSLLDYVSKGFELLNKVRRGH